MPNGRNSLRLVSSVPRNGAVGVSRNVRAQLVFNRNVVADSVWNNNRRQIRLLRGNLRVGAKVTRVRPSTNFTRRFSIYVTPINTLRAATNYRIVVSPSLQARNGQRLGRRATIMFITGRNPRRRTPHRTPHRTPRRTPRHSPRSTQRHTSRREE